MQDCRDRCVLPVRSTSLCADIDELGPSELDEEGSFRGRELRRELPKYKNLDTAGNMHYFLPCRASADSTPITRTKSHFISDLP